MDAEKAEKINKLAKSLKESNLAANMQEAFEKAKEILENNSAEEPSSKPEHKEVFADAEKELKTVEELFDEGEKVAELAEETKEDIKELKKEIMEDEESEKDTETEIADTEREIDESEEKAEEIKESAEIIDEE